MRLSVLGVVLYLAVLPGMGQGTPEVSPAPTMHFVHGLWFDGTRMVANDFYSEDGRLTQHPRDPRHAAVVDLAGRYVVPPYGDAHEHNFDGVRGTAELDATYLHDGIFYAQGMTDTTEGAKQVVAAHLVDTPTTPDVTYAHGGLTGINGHPKDVYDALALGFYYGITPEQKAAVLATHARRGLAYWELATPADIDAQWPAILAAKPDLIKVYLSDSAHYRLATAIDPELGKGIDPRLVPLITARAHAAGLRVAAHVDTAFDFHVAVAGGVDILAHMPGYETDDNFDPELYAISAADVSTAKEHGDAVIPTASIGAAASTGTAAERALTVARRRALQKGNLGRLKAAEIPILVGSDHYGQDALVEADYLQSLGLWTPLEMLRMWSVTTPQAIFPKRRLGQLQEGYEASFLVLRADPLKDWAATHSIVSRWKEGVSLPDTPAATHP